VASRTQTKVRKRFNTLQLQFLIGVSVSLLLPHASVILELTQRCLADSDRTESTVRLCIGLIGDLADSFPNGEIKQLLLTEWIATELRSKGRGQSVETKRTLKWAREVCQDIEKKLLLPLTLCIRSSSAQRHRSLFIFCHLLSSDVSRNSLLLFIDDAYNAPHVIASEGGSCM
jgi:hypothetical protein